MQVDQIVQQLEDNAAVFKSLLEPVAEPQYRWKPSPGYTTRQINRLKYQYFETNCNNSLAYAGNW